MASLFQLLGKPQFQSRTTVPFLTDKRYQLLAYLAYQHEWVGRERLQFLFWSDQAGEAAQRNLRRLLGRVRDLDWLKSLESHEQFLRWHVDTDVAVFRRAIQAKNWQNALDVYRGPLLSGLEGDSQDEFTIWLEREREQLQQNWRTAVLKRAEELQGVGSLFDAIQTLEPLLAMDNLDEEALKAYMQWAFQAGGREQALKAYDRFAKCLYEELTLRPTIELEQLAEQIRKSKGSSAKVAPLLLTEPLASNVPTMATSFVGRDPEILEMTRSLADPNCRLLTLTGVGGIGKTRLSLKIAEQLKSAYPDGVYFVALEPLSNPTLIASSIAHILGTDLQKRTDPLEQVKQMIGQKEMLLILDNYEHLLEGAIYTSKLLQACSNLRLLVTSRERLNVEEECFLTLEGLTLPNNWEQRLDNGQHFDAFNLFTQRAKQVRPDFSLNQRTLPAVLEICQWVEGSPLGIELAASWVRFMSPEDIAKEISENLDFLSSTSRNKHERHQSMRAVFDYSWQLLSPAEQSLLRRLSVFQDGFTRIAAKAVTQASLPVLAALVDKSLLRFGVTDRYTFHTLVSQYSSDKLDEHPDEKAQTEEAHALYYLHFLREHVETLHTSAYKTGRQLITEDWSNIRSAWVWAVKHNQMNTLIEMTFVLSDALEGRHLEGEQLFSQTIATLDKTLPQHPLALAHILIGKAEQQGEQLIDPTSIKNSLQQGLELLKPFGESRAMVRGLRAMAGSEMRAGNFTHSKSILQESLTLARHYGTVKDVGRIIVETALVTRYISISEEATSAFMENALKELRILGDLNHLAYLLLIYGAHLVYEGQLNKGEALLKETLQLMEGPLGAKQEFFPYVLLDLARVAHMRKDYDEAEKLLQRVLQHHQLNKNAHAIAFFLLGRVAAFRGEAQALDYFCQSLQIAWDNQIPVVIPAALVYLAEWYMLQNQPAKAVELLSGVLQQKALVQSERKQALQLLEELAPKLNADQWAAAEAQAPTLPEAIPALLEEIRRLSSSEQKR